jgi:hypothetical protein
MQQDAKISIFLKKIDQSTQVLESEQPQNEKGKIKWWVWQF